MKNAFAVLFVLVLEACLAAAPCFPSVAVDEEEVVFTLAGESAGRAYLIGDFNGWNPTIDLMVATEGGLEIRLYLLPGSYRYRFVLDGVSRPDPDNPCVDAEGNSCFTLVETNGALEVVLLRSTGARGVLQKTEIESSGRIDAVFAGGNLAAFSRGTVAGVIDEKIDMDCSIGVTQYLREDGGERGEAVFLRGLAAYRFDRGALRAWSRDPRIGGAGDPLHLFGAVGPYRYPLGLFCRGMSFEGKLPFGIETWTLYASRLEGYRSGLESGAAPETPFPSRDGVDSDLMGAVLGAKRGGTRLRYLFRQDRRPIQGDWSYWRFGNDLYRGFERVRVQGLSLSIMGAVTAEGEVLFGNSRLLATERSTDGGASFNDASFEDSWRQSWRLYAGIASAWERIRSKLSYTETCYGDRGWARVEEPDGSRRNVEGLLSYGAEPLSLGLRAAYETYSERDAGSRYRFADVNFWLDGDEVAHDLIPFLYARDIYEVELSCGWKVEPAGDLPWGRGLRFEALHRDTPGEYGPLFRKIELSYGLALHPRVDFLLDMRGVTYRYNPTGNEVRRDFVDAFLSVRARVTDALWCALGVGVDPYAFDRWFYAFSDHGREEYLAEHGVFDALAASGTRAAMDRLIEAEEALAEDWVVTLEAGFTF